MSEHNPTEKGPKKLYRFLITVELEPDGSGGEVGIGVDPPGSHPGVATEAWILAAAHLVNAIGISSEDYEKMVKFVLDEATNCKVRMSGGQRVQ